MSMADGQDRRAVQDRLRAQVEMILEGVPGVAAEPENWQETGVDYFYRRKHLLVRDEDIARVAELIQGRVVRPDSTRAGVLQGDSKGAGPIGEERPHRGLSRFEVTEDGTVPQILERLDALLGVGVATPDHLLFVVGHASHCPAVEPDPAGPGASPVPPATEGCGGAGVLVHILDSGWIPGSDQRHSWLRDVDGDVEDTYFPSGPRQGEIMSYSGHGTFCAGVLRAVAPGAEVYVEKSFFGAGGAFESDIVAQVRRGLGLGVDIFSLSAGCYSRRDATLLGFEVIQEMIADHKGVVLVAAAGNDQTRRPFWPAASPSTVSVGALDADGTGRAWYSNHGGWVDVYAPGTDLVNAYAEGVFTYVEPPRAGTQATFEGMARWSGTSFATPLVAGLIADRMHRTGENGRTAAAALIRQAQKDAIPGVGAVLRP